MDNKSIRPSEPVHHIQKALVDELKTKMKNQVDPSKMDEVKKINKEHQTEVALQVHKPKFSFKASLEKKWTDLKQFAADRFGNKNELQEAKQKEFERLQQNTRYDSSAIEFGEKYQNAATFADKQKVTKDALALYEKTDSKGPGAATAFLSAIQKANPKLYESMVGARVMESQVIRKAAEAVINQFQANKESRSGLEMADQLYTNFNAGDKAKFVASLAADDKGNILLKAVIKDYAQKNGEFAAPHVNVENAKGAYLRAGSLAQDLLRAKQNSELADAKREVCEPVLETVKNSASLNVNPDKGSVREGAKEELQTVAQNYISRALQASKNVSPEMKDVYRTLYNETKDNFGKGGEDVASRAVLSQFFLRTFSPAIVADPSLGEEARTNAMFVTKLVQNTVNGVGFGDKERHMSFANSFVIMNQSNMQDMVHNLIT